MKRGAGKLARFSEESTSVLIALLGIVAIVLCVILYQENGFSQVNVTEATGTVEIVANGRSGTLKLKEGSGITFSADKITDTITITNSGSGSCVAQKINLSTGAAGVIYPLLVDSNTGEVSPYVSNNLSYSVAADELRVNNLSGPSGLSIFSTGTLSISAGGGIYLEGLEWPSGMGTDGQVLTTNGTDTMTWRGVSTLGATSLGGLSDCQVGGAGFTNSITIGSVGPTGVTSSEFNTGVGLCVLTGLISGRSNTVLGYNSGSGITTGSENTFIGTSAGSNTGITGSNNSCVGHNCQPSTNSVSNEVTLGNTSVDTIRAATSVISTVSDERDKKNIKDSEYGLEFLSKIRPVEFEWDKRVLNEGDRLFSKNGQKRIGFIAQQLQGAMKEGDNDKLDLVYEENPERIEAKYGSLLPVLVKAVQELNEEVKNLKN